MTYSKDFLIKLSTQQHQTKYARITALDINDKPAEAIEGAITGGGPISIDGTSAVRRTCNISIAAARNANVTNVYWALTNKFKVEIGLANNIDSSYPDIIWLNQGVYAITSFSTSESATHLNVSISGRDKMVKLNGEMGGAFQVSTKLDTLETVNKDGSVTYQKIPIYYIIRNMVHELGNEPWENIIINDLDTYGYELWDYRGVDNNVEVDSEGNTKQVDMPMYYFRDTGDTKKVRNMTIDGDKKIFISGSDRTVSSLSDDELYIDADIADSTPTSFKLSNNEKTYYAQKIQYGEVAGYHQTDLIYPGDLIMNPGESVTSALDKIKSLLGEFEYFYDVNGKFIFQKKKTYVNNLFSPISGDRIEPFVEVSQYTYDFDNKDELVISISNSYSINEVKNDFTIWGSKRSLVGGDKLPVHARYAIDKRPTYYKTFPWYKKPLNLTYLKITEMYQLELDNGYVLYYTPGSEDKYEYESYLKSQITYDAEGKVTSGGLPNEGKETGDTIGIVMLVEPDKDDIVVNNAPAGALTNIYVKSLKEAENIEYYRAATREEINDYSIMKYYLEMKSMTGNEVTDQLYKFTSLQDEFVPAEHPHPEDGKWYRKEDGLFIEWTNFNLDEAYYLKEGIKLYASDEYIGEKSPDKIVDWRELIYLMARDYYQNNQDPNYIINLINKNPQFAAARRTGYEQYYADMQGFWRDLYNPWYEDLEEDKQDQFFHNGDNQYWNRNILHAPQQLDFWFDFLDTGGEIDNYGVQKIGHRPKVEQAQASGVTAISYKQRPDVQFIVMPIENPEIDSSKSILYIQDSMRNLFTISSEGKDAFTRIDELIWKHACGAEGKNITCIPLYFLEPNTRIKIGEEDFIITKISLPLTYNSTMQLTTTKIIKPI